MYQRKQHKSSTSAINRDAFFAPSTARASGQSPPDQTTVAETTATTDVAPTVTPLLLTEEQITDAIRYMRNQYARQSIDFLRRRFGLEGGNNVDRELILAIAEFQSGTQSGDNPLTIDGKLGPNTFDQLHAEGGELMQDVVMFSVMSPLSGRMTINRQANGMTDMLGHFTVEIHLPPGEDAAAFEYRQYICGNIEMLPANAGVTDPMVDLASIFTVPGGLNRIPNYSEDGNTTLNARYGHRRHAARPESRYLNATGAVDQANGHIFKSFDFPGITGRITNTGELYDFDFRFMGQIRHRDRGVVATKFWSVKENFTI
jgi:hypothetical protein